MRHLTAPDAMRRVWAGLTITFLILWPVAHITGWVHSNTFISDISIIALILAAGAGWVAARIEAERDREDVPGEVVERIKEDERSD